ncbi:hypothetical protein GA0061099_1004154 [Bradyrhizobium yuanmingense]|uniref:Uncharacterized protein n=1 Tax=Bradyrhizobium yuanmingense TaxID=108015 RepID=A0A1C3VLF0_9BRAD|nr:hypothetical protein IQ15_01913 [Bradyrhizobium yuanmingense]SCB28427.1 hypothetical protein GA0061099_1004154 [Bradyrhizobium yuanmingense]
MHFGEKFRFCFSLRSGGRDATALWVLFVRSPAVALACSVAAFAATASAFGAEIPSQAEDRFVAGLVKLLSAPVDLAPGVLSALAEKQGEVLETGDAFWPSVVGTVTARREVNEALQVRLRSSFPGNRDLYLRLTRQLPDIADILAKTLVFDGAGTVDGKPVDEVLRRMRMATPAAQRALIARATDATNAASGELIERVASYPEILAGMENDVVGLRRPAIWPFGICLPVV